MHFRRLHYNTMACKEFCAEGGIVSIKVYDHLSQNNIADLFYHIWLPHIVHHISKIMHEIVRSTCKKNCGTLEPLQYGLRTYLHM